MFPDRFILLDLEINTKDELSLPTKWSRPGDYKETIQIGAAKILKPEFIVGRFFERIVKPVKNPLLSEHIIGLTRITQERVDKEGISLEQALKELTAFCGDMPIYCFGDDGVDLHDNCKLLGITCPIPLEQFNDLITLLESPLRTLDINVHAYSSGTLLQAFGLEFKQAHDALNDVSNLTLVLQELNNRGRL